MEEIRYMISDAAKQIDVESHVLRYWEEELEMDIPRNEMGHRYYREADITTMKAVKRLKDQGYQLKLIKMILPEIERVEQLEPGKLLNLKEQLELVTGLRAAEPPAIAEAAAAKEEGTEPLEMGESETGFITRDEKMLRFREIMGGIVLEAVADNNTRLVRAVSDTVSERVIKEMNYLVRAQEEREEERFRQFDQILRGYQKGKKHTAAAKEGRRRKGLFKRRAAV